MVNTPPPLMPARMGRYSAYVPAQATQPSKRCLRINRPVLAHERHPVTGHRITTGAGLVMNVEDFADGDPGFDLGTTGP